MFAKQTILSASLVVVLGGLAHAQPAATPPSDPPPDEARARSGQLTVGAGYDTDDGFIFGAGIKQPSLFGSGRSLSLDASLSMREQRADLTFADPVSLGGGATLEATLFADRKQLPELLREANGGAVTLRRKLGDHTTTYTSLVIESVSADPGVSFLGRVEGGGNSLTRQSGTIVALRNGIEYSTLDSKMLPTRGTEIGAWFEVADPIMGSDYNLGSMHVWASTHQSLGPFIAHVGGSMTAIASHDPGGVPLSERLYLDGSSEIRGFAPGAIGPIGGGTFMALGRLELEAPLFAGVSVRTFGDAGTVLDDLRGGAGYSAGFGVVWRSPVGPLSFDWAYPFGQGPPRFLLGIGKTF